MTMHVRHSGIAKQVTTAFIKQGGVWKQVTNAWIKQAGVWRQFLSPGGGFLLGSGNYADTSTSTLSPSVTFTPAGAVNSGVTSVNSTWGTPSTPGAGNSYWIKFSLGSGNATYNGPTLDTWLQLSMNRSVTQTAAPAGQVRTRNINYEISNAAGGSVLDSGTIILEHDRS